MTFPGPQLPDATDTGPQLPRVGPPDDLADLAASREIRRELVLDDEIGEPTDDDEVELLGAIEAELKEPVQISDVTWEVPDRPGYAVSYTPTVSSEDLQLFLKRARKRRGRGGAAMAQATGEDDVDNLRMSTMMLATYCTAILRNGKVITHLGEPVTFRTPIFAETLGATSAQEAVRKLYGADGPITAAGRQLLDVSGFTQDLSEIDPDNPVPASPTRRR